MQNSTATIIALLVAGVLLFIVPLVTLTDRSDNVAQENVKLIVEAFLKSSLIFGLLLSSKVFFKVSSIEKKLGSIVEALSLNEFMFIICWELESLPPTKIFSGL